MSSIDVFDAGTMAAASAMAETAEPGPRRSDDVVLQTAAAYVLAGGHLSTHRALVERLAASWPRDAPYDAILVRELLEEAQEDEPASTD